jgi:hypothetical protein
MGEKKKKKNPLVVEISLKWYPVWCPLSSSLLCFTLTLHVSLKSQKLGSKLKRKGEYWVILMVWAFLLGILCTLRTSKREGERERREEEKEQRGNDIDICGDGDDLQGKTKKVLGFEL